MTGAKNYSKLANQIFDRLKNDRIEQIILEKKTSKLLL